MVDRGKRYNKFELISIVRDLIPYDIPDLTFNKYTDLAKGSSFDYKDIYKVAGRLLLHLSLQPNIKQGSVSINWSEWQIQHVYNTAKRYLTIAEDYEGLDMIPKETVKTYGYKGDKL